MTTRTAGRTVAYWARRAVEMEIGAWQSLYRFLLRRPRVPAGATAFPYHRVVLPVLITFIVVSAIELVAVDLLVHRWPAVRIPLLIVGIWGLTWMFGLLTAMVTRPHAVGTDGIRARYATDVDVFVPWDAIDSVSRRVANRAEKAPRLARSADGPGALHLWMHEQTNVVVVLDRPLEVRLPEATATVDRIALYADDPTAFLAAVRAQVARSGTG